MNVELKIEKEGHDWLVRGYVGKTCVAEYGFDSKEQANEAIDFMLEEQAWI